MNIESRSYTPMTVGNWLLTMVIMAIPLVGLIMQLVWAFSNDTHPSKKTFCQASLIMLLIFIVLFAGIAILGGIFGAMSTPPSNPSFSP
jgi:hypothetical protein